MACRWFLRIKQTTTEGCITHARFSVTGTLNATTVCQSLAVRIFSFADFQGFKNSNFPYRPSKILDGVAGPNLTWLSRLERAVGPEQP